MKTHPSPLLKHCHKGSALLITLSAVIVFGIMGASVIKLTSTSQGSYLSANSTSRAYFLAESGLSYAQNAYVTDGWRHGRQRTLNFDGGGEVSIIRKGDYFWATSVVDAGTATEGRANVPMLISALDLDPDAPKDRATGDYAIFGDTVTAVGQNNVIEGDVAMIGADISLKADVQGSIFARDVNANGQGTILEINGGIYSSGFVSLQSASVEGDVHAASGIDIRSAEATVKGWLFANGPISLGGGAAVLGDVHANGGDVTIGGNVTVGTPDNPVEIRTTGDVYLSQTAKIYGTIYAGGSIIFSDSAAVYGDAYAGGSINTGKISGEALAESSTYLEDPIEPDLSSLEGLELPPTTDFVAGDQAITLPQLRKVGSPIYSLLEGAYSTLQAPNNSSGRYAGLLLSAGLLDHANYYFDSVNIGPSNKLYLNLVGSQDLRVFVEGDVTLSLSEVYISTDGINYVSMDDPALDPSAAARVYWESHGKFDLASGGRFYGSVYTPYGNLNVGNTSLLYGSYYSGGGHNIVGSTLVHVVPNYYGETETK